MKINKLHFRNNTDEILYKGIRPVFSTISKLNLFYIRDVVSSSHISLEYFGEYFGDYLKTSKSPPERFLLGMTLAGEDIHIHTLSVLPVNGHYIIEQYEKDCIKK